MPLVSTFKKHGITGKLSGSDEASLSDMEGIDEDKSSYNSDECISYTQVDLKNLDNKLDWEINSYKKKESYTPGGFYDAFASI